MLMDGWARRWWDTGGEHRGVGVAAAGAAAAHQTGPDGLRCWLLRLEGAEAEETGWLLSEARWWSMRSMADQSELEVLGVGEIGKRRGSGTAR